MPQDLGDSLEEHLIAHFNYVGCDGEKTIDDIFVNSVADLYVATALGLDGRGAVEYLARSMVDMFETMARLNKDDAVRRDIAQEVLQFLEMPIAEAF